MSKTISDLRTEMDAKIPRSAVSLRDGGGSRKLSYLEGHYVINRLNQVIGQGNWAYDTVNMTCVHQGTNDRGGFTAHYIAKVRLAISLPDGLQTEFQDYGYGDGTDRTSAGKCHELAVKEAVTDGLKRCAKNLGMSFGLALYDKTQENVEDEAQGHATTGSKQSETRAQDSRGPETNISRSLENANSNNAPAKESKPVPAPKGPGRPKSREEINSLITSTAKIVVAKNIKTNDELKSILSSKYQASGKEALTDEQAAEFLTHLKSLI